MMYKVIKHFIDLQDNNHAYNAGDSFPRSGVSVTDERLAELAGSDNKQGVPLIEKIESAPQGIPVEAPKKKRKKTAEK